MHLTEKTNKIAYVDFSLGMTTGNLAKKKRNLEENFPTRGINRTASVQKPVATATSYLVRSHTKRNLLNQYNDENVAGFAKPNGIQQKRMLTANKKQGVRTLFLA